MVPNNGVPNSLEAAEILNKIKGWINQINRPLNEVERKELIELLSK